MSKTTASLFTGGGGFEQGAMMAGYTPVWGVEIRPDIAEWAELNTPGLKVIVSDVAAVDYAGLPKVDHLHASPSCKKASIANNDGGESPEDIEAALAVCRAIKAIRPDSFTLENVWGYREFEAFKLIVGQLVTLGYYLDWWHLNSADYSVPQTRKRLILVARLDRQPARPQPTHSKTPDMFGVYKPWIGWYEAIEDLIDTLPDSEFAPWQLERLPVELKSMLLAQGGFDGQIVNREPGEPSFTVTSNSNQAGPRAIITGGKNAGQEWGKFYRDDNEPVSTVSSQNPRLKAFIIPGDNSGNGVIRFEGEPMNTIQTRPDTRCPHRAYLTPVNGESSIAFCDNLPAPTVAANHGAGKYRAHLAGRVVKMTPRALARFQSFPDSYQLPDAPGLACEIIGNAVACLLAKAICESLKD